MYLILSIIYPFHHALPCIIQVWNKRGGNSQVILENKVEENFHYYAFKI